MAEFVFLIVMCSLVIVCGLAMLCLGLYDGKDEKLICGGIFTSFVGMVLLVIAINTYDERMARAYDEFLQERGQVYSCQNQGKVECEYYIKKWRKDSVEWNNRIKSIMERY